MNVSLLAGCHLLIKPICVRVLKSTIVRQHRSYSTMYSILANFEQDQPQRVDCSIKGNVPKWLKGALYRNGTAMFKFGEDTARHWFDGMACIHKYSFDDGKVQYQNRLLETDTLKRNLAANRIVVEEFGTLGYPDPCKSIFTRHFSYYFGTDPGTDNNSVNVTLVGDQLYAMTETSTLLHIDKDTLGTLGKVDISKYVSVNLETAHPHLDADGTSYNIGQIFGRVGKYAVIKLPKIHPGDAHALEQLSLLGTIDAQWQGCSGYAHSFGLSENYVIFVEQPFVFNGLKAMSRRFAGRSIQECLEWKEGYQTIIHVMSKETGECLPIKFKTDPLFTFHHINSYEEDGHLVVDLSAYDNGSIVSELLLENIKKNGSLPLATFRRYVLPLEINQDTTGDENLVKLSYTTATAKKAEDGSIFCSPEIFKDQSFELPRINYRGFNRKKYRYAYGIHLPSMSSGELVKVDIEKKEFTKWLPESEMLVAEPVFVSSPDAKSEDDGIVLAPVTTGDATKQPFLVMLDGKSFKEVARATVPVGVSMPYTFHGMFLTSK